MQNYLCKRFQKTAINGFFIKWTKIITGVPLGSILEPLLLSPECKFLIMYKCFHENHMVLNLAKLSYMLIRNKSHDDIIIFNGVELKASNKEKLLGVLIDKNLGFNIHIKSM